MKNRTFSTMLASAAILGSTMVGCSGAGIERPRVAVSDAQTLAPRIERLLGDKDVGQALALAERLVEAEPRNGAARALLGRAYLANGRYLSARTAFNDALALGNRDPRTIVSLALSEAGLGDLDNARRLLASHIADLPAGDYGLAMAMAGDPREGVRALLEAVQAPDATVKTRQNLAYALAMAGAWGQARLIAGQDLSARDAEARIGQWSQVAVQGSAVDRVVAMIGVAPRGDDAGLPVRLALDATPEPARPAVRLASAADLIADARAHVAQTPAQDAPASEAAPATVSPLAPATSTAESVQQAVAPPVAPTPSATFAPNALADALARLPATAPAAPAPSVAAQVAFAPAPAAAKASPAPAVAPAVLQAAFAQSAPVSAPVVQAAVHADAAPAPTQKAVQQSFRAAGAVAAPAPAGSGRAHWTAGIGAPASDARASDWVVQLGAFDSLAVAREKWQRMSAGREVLRDFNSIHSQFTLNGRTFHRLAIRGFEDRGAATTACAALKASGQDCFVRLDDTQTTRLARAGGLTQDTQLAVASSAGRSRPAR